MQAIDASVDRRHSILHAHGDPNSPRRQSFAVSFDVKDAPHHQPHYLERRDSHYSTSSRRPSSLHSLFSNVVDLDQEDFENENYSEDEIRKRVFGPKLMEMNLGNVDTSVSRPTVASARRSVLWSRERKMYETNNQKNTQEFKSQPYMFHEYPGLEKHYPGTWRKVTQDEMQAIITRLTRTTYLSRVRSAPVRSRRKCDVPNRFVKSAAF